MSGPVHLRVHWHPEDQAWLLTQQNRRGNILRIQGWKLLAGGLLLGASAPLAARLARWATMNPLDPAPLLHHLTWDDATVAGSILGVTLLLALLQLLAERFGLRTALEGRVAEGREPLLGPVEVGLSPDRATFQGTAWESTFNADLFNGLEEKAGYLVLSFGPARRTILPRRDLSATEALAVREWAAGILHRRGSPV